MYKMCSEQNIKLYLHTHTQKKKFFVIDFITLILVSLDNCKEILLMFAHDIFHKYIYPSSK